MVCTTSRTPLDGSQNIEIPPTGKKRPNVFSVNFGCRIQAKVKLLNQKPRTRERCWLCSFFTPLSAQCGLYLINTSTKGLDALHPDHNMFCTTLYYIIKIHPSCSLCQLMSHRSEMVDSFS